MSAISVGARLDRLPVTRLHRKVFNLVGVGMFFEGFDIYIAASVLGATYKTGFSTLAQFTRLFRHHAGEAPSEFRARHRNDKAAR